MSNILINNAVAYVCSQVCVCVGGGTRLKGGEGKGGAMHNKYMVSKIRKNRAVEGVEDVVGVTPLFLLVKLPFPSPIISPPPSIGSGEGACLLTPP